MPTRPQEPLPHDIGPGGAETRSRFARSPHPYHRQSFDLPDRIHSNQWLLPDIQSSRDSLALQGRQLHVPAYFDYDGRKRRKSTTSPSDSGTEADDERPLLRALTAPPSRPRKGLKDHRGTDSDPQGSPLLTPSPLEDERDRSLPTRAYRERRRSRSTTKADGTKAKEKQRRRGHAEYGRRILETALLGLSGYLSFQASGQNVGQGG